jgi:hypothetical protein
MGNVGEVGRKKWNVSVDEYDYQIAVMYRLAP